MDLDDEWRSSVYFSIRPTAILREKKRAHKLQKMMPTKYGLWLFSSTFAYNGRWRQYKKMWKINLICLLCKNMRTVSMPVSWYHTMVRFITIIGVPNHSNMNCVTKQVFFSLLLQSSIYKKKNALMIYIMCIWPEM